MALVLGLSFCFSQTMNGWASQETQKKININTASADELQKLPGIGAKIAQRIIDYRKEHGEFKRIEEIMKVKGIGEKTFNRIKDLITVGDSEKKK